MRTPGSGKGKRRQCLAGLLVAWAFLTPFVWTRVVPAETVPIADALVERTTDLGALKAAAPVLGRDGGYSVLFQNRSFWFYGDTIVSLKGGSPALLSSSCSWTPDLDASDGITQFTPCRDSEGVPAEFFPFTRPESAFNRDHRADGCRHKPCGARWALWPGAAVSDTAHDRLMLFYKKVLIRPGFLNIETAGHSLALWRPFQDLPQRIGDPAANNGSKLMFSKDEPAFGSAALVDNSILYVFGCSLEGQKKPCRLARVPLAVALDRRLWSFYNAFRGWQNSVAECSVIFEGNDMMSFSYNRYLRRYLVVYSRPMSTDVLVRTAASIEGPWSAPLKAFKTLRPASDTGWVYDAMEHPEYAGENGKVVFITYSRQTGPLTFELRLVALTFR